MNYDEFSKLPDRVKIEARLSWLEQRTLDIIWLLIALTSTLAGIVVTWLFRAILGIETLWLLIPMFVCTSFGTVCSSEDPSRIHPRISSSLILDFTTHVPPMTDYIVDLFQRWGHLSLTSGVAVGLFFMLAALVIFPRTILIVAAGASFGIGAAPIILVAGTAG